MRRRADFETTPSLMSTAVSPPSEVGGLSKMCPFPVNAPPKSLCLSALFAVIFGSGFETFSLCTLFATS